jgi:ElaB/YqjD/DUF883 family membrane-anchored ribosome-binding protein
MNTPDPLGPQGSAMQDMAGQAASKASSAMETAREKLESARDTAREKLEAAGQSARETMHVAREKVEHAGSSLLQWTRENPATALAVVFGTGFVIGSMLGMTRHEKTFTQRLGDDPVATLRDAMQSALAPIREGIYSAAESAKSAADTVVDRVSHSRNGHSLSHRLRDLGDNLKFW